MAYAVSAIKCSQIKIIVKIFSMKNLLILGKVLNKSEQKQVKGSNGSECYECLPDAPPGSAFACAGANICQVMPDGCHICV